MKAESEVTPKEEAATEGRAQAGFHRIQVTLGLTLGFLYSEGGSLPNGVNRHGNYTADQQV